MRGHGSSEIIFPVHPLLMGNQLETQKSESELQVFHETNLGLLPVNMNFLVPANAPSILSGGFFFLSAPPLLVSTPY